MTSHQGLTTLHLRGHLPRLTTGSTGSRITESNLKQNSEGMLGQRSSMAKIGKLEVRLSQCTQQAKLNSEQIHCKAVDGGG